MESPRLSILRHKLLTLLLALVATASLGGSCGGSSAIGPEVTLTLHSIDEDLNDILVQSSARTLIVNASFTPGGEPIDPATVSGVLHPWSGGADLPLLIWSVNTEGTIGVAFPGTLTPGTWTAIIWAADTAGNTGVGQYSFAVRDPGASPPIGSGQQIWLDFESDRDAVPGADFPVDLESFGLATAGDATGSSAIVAQRVVDAVVARTELAYHSYDPTGMFPVDPVAVSFHTSDPGAGDVTQICIGGENPGGTNAIGSILIDPGNANRNSVECSTLPPTGIFPRELLIYQGQANFDDTFDPLLANPVGSDPLDPIVLAPGFDPGSAPSEQVERYDQIDLGVVRYADALGSVVAHEAGHALGLVAPGAPGGGLHGGLTGAEFSHDVNADGTTSPAQNYLMKHGGKFNFTRLAGLSGQPLPYFRPIDHAYLRDRLVLDGNVTMLIGPATVTGVTPQVISSSMAITVEGTGFEATPSLRLENETFTYELIGENLISSSEMTGWVLTPQILPGDYLLILRNADGQESAFPGVVTVE